MEYINNDIIFNNDNYNSKWNIFSYELDNFQKYAFEALDNDKNVLITAHTGSGKTTIAEYAILKYTTINTENKIIYTTPIKALSNQIYKNLSEKYPFINIGIKTGDIDINSEDASLVIMTTEILRNKLFLDNNEENGMNSLKCVIFDEVHWIKDKDRGHIWEQSLISLNKNIQLIMLSATIPNINKFSEWIYKVRDYKPLTIITTKNRIIPLTHYLYINNELIEIMDNNYNFNESLFNKIKNKYYFHLKNLNEILEDLSLRQLLPAFFFCFNRKKCEEYAESITIPLIETKTQAENNNYFNFLLSKHKFMNEDGLIQTEKIRQLIIKGVGFHHSGLHPILKEVIETMFNKNMLKILFVTETFAAGVNMPTKTVVFTGLEKYNNGGFRPLLKEEYLQMAGRAGRRGKDVKGTVIIMPFNNNLENIPNILKSEITGLKSQFKIDINFILKMINMNLNPFEYYKNSIQMDENNIIQNSIINDYNLLNDKVNNMKNKIYKVDENDFYQNIIEYLNSNGNKKKKIESNFRRLEKDEYEKIKNGINYYNEYVKLESKLENLNNDINNNLNYEKKLINNTIDLLIKYEYFLEKSISKNINENINEYFLGKSISKNIKENINEYFLGKSISKNINENINEYFLEKSISKNIKENINENINEYFLGKSISKNINEYINEYILTEKGKYAVLINECDPILLIEIVYNNILNDLNFEEICCILSIFIESKSNENIDIDDLLDININKKISFVKNKILEINKFINQNNEIIKEDIFIKSNYELYLYYLWASGTEYRDLNFIDFYIGDFIKGVLKLCTIFEKLLIIYSKYDLVIYNIIKDYRIKLIRSVITPESLYIHTYLS